MVVALHDEYLNGFVLRYRGKNVCFYHSSDVYHVVPGAG